MSFAYWFYVPVAVFFVALALSFTKKQPLRRIAATVAVISASILLFSAIGGAVFLWILFGKEPPSLATLQKEFPSQRNDLETILGMSNEDSHFWRIAPTFLDRDSQAGEAISDQVSYGRYMQDDPRAGLSKERWDQYRAIYARNGIKLGIRRDQAHDAFIMVDSVGLLNRGHTTGYLYCSAEKEMEDFRFEPCTLNQSSGSRKYDAQSRVEGYSFQKLSDGWYAFDEGPS
jgi:hypothetical protein